MDFSEPCQNNELSYPGSSEPSLLGDLPHTITLKKNVSGAWRIMKDDYLDDTLKSMAGTTKADVLNTIHTNILAAQKMQMSASNETPLSESEDLSGTSVHPELAAYSYHPSYAVGYADAQWNTAGAKIPGYIQSNPGFVAGWKTTYRFYPGVGATGDCTNFASQAIFLGVDGIDSDPNYFYPNPSESLWYYDFSGSVDGPTGVAGSTPWVRVGALYDFLTTNTGRGPYGSAGASPSINVCGLVPGDVIMMKGAAGWEHTVILRATVTTCGYTPFGWVDAHTTNVRNAPLSNYLNFSWFPVHIKGYRK